MPHTAAAGIATPDITTSANLTTRILPARIATPILCTRRVRTQGRSYATAGRDAKTDWKALSQRIGHADVAFTMKQYVQTDLEADRQVANTLAELIIGGSLAST